MNSSESIIKLKDLIVATLDKHKAEDIVVIDLKTKTDIADFMIVATGRSNKHVASTAEFILTEMKQLDKSYFVEGMNNSDWVLIDIFDILVHIFTKEKRELYSLEELWLA